jgi:hypothetical protein
MADRLSATNFTLFWSELLAKMTISNCPKSRQIEDDVLLDIGPFADTRALRDFQIVAANLARWMPLPSWPGQAEVLVDVTRGRVQFPEAIAAVGDPVPAFHPKFHHIGVVHRVGAGPFPRESEVPIGPPVENANMEVPVNPPSAGTLNFRDNRRYVWQWDALTRNHDVAGDLRLEAADQTRPYLLSRGPEDGLDFTITGTEGRKNTLVIDGLWLGMLATAAIKTNLINPDDPFPIAKARLIFFGRFESLTLRHVTIDPGGEQARLDPLIARAIPSITTEIEGSIKTLRIENSVLGPLVETRNDPSIENAGVIRIDNSILCSIAPGDPVISTDLSRLFIENSTVIGAVHAGTLFATNTIFDGPMYVTNRQQSCLRFSAVAAYRDMPGIAPSTLPRRFECMTFPNKLPPKTFRSKRFGDPDFAAVSHLADTAFLTGGEHRTEMGVGHERFWNQRRQDLALYVAKFLPVGQNVQIYEEIGGPT